MGNFIDRKYKDNPNRKKLTIVSQSADTIIADITDFSELENAGTAITAQIMNTFEDNIAQATTTANTAKQESESAISTANTASENSQTALIQASEAKANSEEAISISNDAKSKALEVESKLADRGATIKINASTVTEVIFSSDPQTQIDSKLTQNFESLSGKTTIADSDIFVLQNSADTTSPKSSAKVLFSTIKSQIIDTLYPIGTIYMSISSSNPQNYLGGTWVAWGGGRMPVGIGSNGETTYSTAEQAGGSENSVAPHTHTQTSHTHGLLSPSDGDHWSSNANSFSNNNDSNGYVAALDKAASSSNGYQYCTTNATSYNYVQSSQPIINNSGISGGNMPPYITCYMWKRTN